MQLKTTFRALRDGLFRYYDTPFALRSEVLERERRALLDRDGVSWRKPFVEPIRDWRNAPGSIVDALTDAGAPPELAELVGPGLMDGAPSLRLHQKQMLDSAMRGRCSVVTAGTGSGKTEAFLLPILADLVRESADWSEPAPVAPAWWSGKGPWEPQRAEGRGRPAAIRALVLYPMNALVEDQLMRLRRALDGPEARSWLAKHRPGHRFYFGRYTGQTPVSGSRESETAVALLRRRLREIGEKAGRAAEMEREAPVKNEGVSYFVLPPGRRRDAVALGHAGRPARPPHHQLLDAQHHAPPQARRAAVPRRRSGGSSATAASSRSSSTSCTCTAALRAPRSPTCCATCSTDST